MHTPRDPSPRRRRYAAALLAFAVVASACGSSDDPPAATSPADDGDESASTTAPSEDVDEPASASTVAPPTSLDTADADETSAETETGPALADDDYGIDLGGGLRVEVAAGERADVAAEITAGSLNDGAVTVSFQPDGAVFATPVRLVVDVDPAAADGLVATSADLTSADGSVEHLEPVLEGESIVFPISHFSDVQVISLKVGEVLVPDGPLGVGDEAAMDFGPAVVETPGVNAAEAAAVIAGIEAIGGWDAAFSNDESVVIVDKTAPTVRCVDEGGTMLYLGAVIVIDGRRWVYNGLPDVDCEAAPSASTVVAADVTATQFHDTGALAGELIDMGALSAIVVEFSDTVNGDVFLVSDANRSGTIDAGDWIPFPAQPVDGDGRVVAPIDAGGPYFVGIVPPGSAGVDALVRAPFDGPMGQDGRWVFTSAQEGTSVVVVRSEDDPTPVFYDVDFGEPVMNPLP